MLTVLLRTPLASTDPALGMVTEELFEVAATALLAEAVTVQLYVLPFVSPLTTSGLA